MATTVSETHVKTVLDKYAAIAAQGTSTTPCMYYYTGEYGWSAYVINSSTSEYSWIHSEDDLIAVASVSDTDLLLETSEDSTDDDYVEYAVTDYVEDSSSVSEDVYSTYLKWQAGYEYDDDTGEQSWNDYDTDIYDYIVGCQTYSLYSMYLATLDDDQDDDTTSVTGFRAFANIIRFLNVDYGIEALEFFTVWHEDQTTKIYQLFYNYLKSKYKPYPGGPGGIVYGDFSDLLLPVPDNLWPCDGSTITNVKAVPQLYGQTAPDLSGRVLASAGNEYIAGETEGAAAITLTADNIPALTSSFTNSPTGTVVISDSGHTHTYTNYFRYLYYVSRDSTNVSDNSAADSGPNSTTAYTDSIETGYDDRYYFHWKRASISGYITEEADTGLSASFTGTSKSCTVSTSVVLSPDTLSMYQPTAFKQAYIIVY